MKQIRFLPLAAALLFCLGLAAPSLADESAEDPRVSLPRPSFRPGAAVSLQISLVSPPGWQINYLVPVLISFDKEQLRKLPIILGKEHWEFELSEYQRTYVAAIPGQVGLKAPDGEYSIPFKVECSICDEAAGACTFSEAEGSALLRVRATAPKSEKNQALAKGIVELSVNLPAPQ